MAGTTGRLGLPYPDSSDSADVPRDIRAVGDAVGNLTNWIRNQDVMEDAIDFPRLDDQCERKVREPTIWLAGLPLLEHEAVATMIPDAPTGSAYWQFQYDSVANGTYKWQFVGGSPLRSYAAAAITNLPNAWTQDPAVSVAIPWAGIYGIEYGMAANIGAGQNAYSAPSAGPAAPAAPADATTERIGIAAAGAITYISMQGVVRVTFSAPGTVRLYNRSSAAGATPSVAARYLRVLPVAVNFT